MQEEDEGLVTAADVRDVLGEGEATLKIPSNMKVVTMAPAPEKLDSLNEASESLIGSTIMMRFEGFGWCSGKLEERNKDRRFKNKGNMVNSIAKFDIDEGTTQLSLQLVGYDTSADAEYDSWMLLEPKEAEEE